MHIHPPSPDGGLRIPVRRTAGPTGRERMRYARRSHCTGSALAEQLGGLRDQGTEQIMRKACTSPHHGPRKRSRCGHGPWIDSVWPGTYIHKYRMTEGYFQSKVTLWSTPFAERCLPRAGAPGWTKGWKTCSLTSQDQVWEGRQRHKSSPRPQVRRQKADWLAPQESMIW